MTIDGYYTKEKAQEISQVISSLNDYTTKEFGKELNNFNMVADNADEIFSKVLNKKVEVDLDRSGIFRFPEFFVHFESFKSLDEWLFVVAIDHSTFNIFEHESGVENALQGYDFNYRNLLEWDVVVNYQLKPGQGVFFRPWLFHSFDWGLIQIFRLRELDANRI
jgi:hypothetical protein